LFEDLATNLVPDYRTISELPHHHPQVINSVTALNEDQQHNRCEQRVHGVLHCGVSPNIIVGHPHVCERPEFESVW
jgi:hypothetical protein